MLKEFELTHYRADAFPTRHLTLDLESREIGGPDGPWALSLCQVYRGAHILAWPVVIQDPEHDFAQLAQILIDVGYILPGDWPELPEPYPTLHEGEDPGLLY
jgi:hypothetical protein